MQKAEFDMVGDDAGMVDDILKELNNEPTTQVVNNINVPSQLPQHIPEPIGQTLVHPDAAILNAPVMVESQNRQTIESKTNWFSVILKKIKKPLVLTLLIYLTFNPITRRLLNNYVPMVFKSSSHLHQNVSILILSIATALVFVGVKNFL